MYKGTFEVGPTRDLADRNSRTFDEREAELKKIEEIRAAQRKREANANYKRFAQYNLAETERMIWLALNHPVANAMLFFVVDQMDKLNALTCTYKVLSEALGVSVSSIKRGAKVLKDYGFMRIARNGTANVYYVDDAIYWKNKGNNKWQSKFAANVVLSLSEQDEDYQCAAMRGDRIEVWGDEYIVCNETGEAVPAG